MEFVIQPYKSYDKMISVVFFYLINKDRFVVSVGLAYLSFDPITFHRSAETFFRDAYQYGNRFRSTFFFYRQIYHPDRNANMDLLPPANRRSIKIFRHKRSFLLNVSDCCEVSKLSIIAYKNDGFELQS